MPSKTRKARPKKRPQRTYPHYNAQLRAEAEERSAALFSLLKKQPGYLEGLTRDLRENARGKRA